MPIVKHPIPNPPDDNPGWLISIFVFVSVVICLLWVMGVIGCKTSIHADKSPMVVYDSTFSMVDWLGDSCSVRIKKVAYNGDTTEYAKVTSPIGVQEYRNGYLISCSIYGERQY